MKIALTSIYGLLVLGYLYFLVSLAERGLDDLLDDIEDEGINKII